MTLCHPPEWHQDPELPIRVVDGEGRCVAEGRPVGEEGVSHAAFIARAASAHDELLAALKKARPAVDELHGQGIGCPDCRTDNPDGSPSCALIDGIAAAIAKAEGR